jgi:hypothetical protein
MERAPASFVFKDGSTLTDVDTIIVATFKQTGVQLCQPNFVDTV